VGDFLDGKSLYRCFYFYDSDFYLHRARIDGAIISTPIEGKLLLNNHSEKYEALKSSKLKQRLMPGVLDPLLEEASGVAYIADCDNDRKDKASTLAFLAKKYGRENMTDITMKHVSGEVLVPVNKSSNNCIKFAPFGYPTCKKLRFSQAAYAKR